MGNEIGFIYPGSRRPRAMPVGLHKLEKPISWQNGEGGLF